MLLLLLISFINSKNTTKSGISGNTHLPHYTTTHYPAHFIRQAQTEWVPPKQGDVFYGEVQRPTTISIYGYEDMLKSKMFIRNFGYFTVAFVELCDTLGNKYPPDVAEIKMSTAYVIHKKSPDWLRQPLYSTIKNISNTISKLPIAQFQEICRTLAIKVDNRRRRPLDRKYNKWFDLADAAITQVDGNNLLHVLRHLKEYPARRQGPQKGLQMCTEIIDAIEKPFVSKLLSDDVQEFLYIINKDLKDEEQKRLSTSTIIDFALSQQKGLDKSVNLALETVFEFDKDGKLDIQLLNNVQKFIGKVKNVLEKKHIERRQTGTDQINIFTNFILNIVNILSQFEDNDLERFFAIINNEIQRYCDENDDAHILNKFSLIRNMPAYVLRRYLKIIANKIEEEAYFEEEKAVIDGVNYIMKQDDTTKIDKFINNLEEYRRKSRRNIDLVQLIKSALQNIFLDGYYRFKPPVKSLLRTILHYYFGNFIPIPTKYPVSKQPNSVNRAKLKTTKESRTWRQMYAEKNLDLKYPYDYTSVTKEQKSRTQKSRLMTVPKTRATKESHYSKGMKYGKVMEYDINYDTSKQTDNLDDEKTTTNMTKMFDEYYYRRFLDKKYNKKLNQFKTSKRGQKKNKAKHKSLNKLSTFYLDLENLSAISYAQQRFETSTHEYERPALVRPFTTGIKHGKHWNSRQNLQKSKHYGYIQKKRQDVFVNEQQINTKNNYLEMSRMPPISLNMQLNINEEPSTLDNDTTLGNRDVKNLLSSEEGLSIEGFQEIKRKIYNRRSASNNDTANNNVFNLIQKIEQDLEVVKTKIHNVSVFKNNNGLDEIIKVTENDVNKLKAGIDLNKRVNQEVINIPKLYLERDRNDVEIKKKKYSSPDEKATFKSTGVNVAEPIYMAARKTIYDQKWYPVVKSGAANSDEIVIQRKYEPLEDALPQQNEHDCQENLNVMNNNVPISKNAPTKYEVPYETLINENNSNTTDNILKEKAKNKELENTTIKKVSANTNNLKDKEKIKVIYKANDDKTLPNYNTNVKLTQDEITNYQNTKENATKQNILIELNKIKDRPTLKSQINEMNNIQNVKLKEITTTKSDNKTTLVTNYKNTTDSAVTVNNLITTQKVTDVIFNNNKF